jgi:hypothetical protein
MTEDGRSLAELPAKAGDSDSLRSVAEALVQLRKETDVEVLIGAVRHDRFDERTTYRAPAVRGERVRERENGCRDRDRETRAGTVEPRILKPRKKQLFSGLSGAAPAV